MLARTPLLLAMLLTLPLASSCAEGNARPPTDKTLPGGSASAPSFIRSAAAQPAASASAAPAEGAVAKGSSAATGASSAPSASAAASSTSAKLPNVEITNIGMHIGGEANTPEQKRPIRAAVRQHYDELRACYGQAEAPAREVTFGVDMRIEGSGGRAKISHPRSAFAQSEVTHCLIAVFETIEFSRPPKGITQMVSFSVRFRRP